MCLSSGLWRGFGLRCPVYHPESTTMIVQPSPVLTLCERVLFCTCHHTYTLYPKVSLDPSVVGLASPCTCQRKDSITRSCASHTCVALSAKSLSFFPPSTSSCLNSKNEGQTCLVQSAEIKVLGKFLTCQYFELPVESPWEGAKDEILSKARQGILGQSSKGCVSMNFFVCLS